MIRYLVLVWLVTFASAEILEVKQLFNKKIVLVKRVERSHTKTFYAQTTLDESKIVDVSLRFSGFVEKLYVDKTLSTVKKGEKLFTIYSQTLSEIKAEIELAKQMRQNGVVRNLQKKLALLNVGKTISSDYKVDIYAPISGLVLQKSIYEGSFVKKGMRIFQLADTSQMWVKFQVYQQDLAFVKEGLEATIMIEGIGELKGRVDYIYPMMDAKRKKVDVRIVLENPNGKIYPNLFAKVALHTSATSILILPKSAVLTKGDKHYVFKPLDGGEFEPVVVEARRLDTQRYEIKSGLKEGDSVIDRALFMLDADAITNGLYDSDDDEDW